MKSFAKLLIAAITFLVLTTHAFAANDTPVGYWKTVDDKTGEVLSIVQIYQADNALQGKIVKIMPVLGQKVTDRCVKCEGDLYNARMLGMVILWGMQQVDSSTWSGGRVLDPKSGNIYNGKMTLEDNGKLLNLRGYIGIPLFGRSETWIRVK